MRRRLPHLLTFGRRTGRRLHHDPSWGLGLGGRHQSALRHFSANQFNGPLAPDPARL